MLWCLLSHRPGSNTCKCDTSWRFKTEIKIVCRDRPLADHRRRSRAKNLLVKELSHGFSCSDYTEGEIKLSSVLQGMRPKIILSLRANSHQIWDLVFTNSLLAKNFIAVVGKGLLQGGMSPGYLKCLLWSHEKLGDLMDTEISGSWWRSTCLRITFLDYKSASFHLPMTLHMPDCTGKAQGLISYCSKPQMCPHCF